MMMAVRRSQSSLLFWTIAFLGLMYFVFLNPNVDVKPFNAHDSVAYLNRASSLWKGGGYGETFADAFFPVTLQPPGFSVLLAPIVGLFGMNFFALKIFMLFLSALMIYSFFQFFKYFLDSKDEANRATLLLAASPAIFGLSHQVLAEVPLFLFCTLGLLSLDRYLRSSSKTFSSLFFFSGLLIITAYFIKVTALGVLAGGWMLLLHPKFRTGETFKKLLLLTLLIAIPVLIWQVWCSSIPKTGFWTQSAWDDILKLNPYQADSPQASLTDLAVRMKHNLAWGLSANMAMGLVAPFYFSDGGTISFVLSLPIMAWLIWWWAKSFIQTPSVLEGFTLFGIGILTLKFEGMAVRYGALLYPALLVYAFRGFVQNFKSGIRAWMPNVLILVAVVTTFTAAFDHWKNPYGGKVVRDYIAIAQKAKGLFPPNSKCGAPMAGHWQVLTEHRCFSSNEQAISSENTSSSADYFVVFSNTAPKDTEHYKDFESHIVKSSLNLTNLIGKYPDRVKKLYENDTFALMKMVKHGH